ncbi:MAG: tyrosine--tRNA ligase [Bacteroidota bacterium]|jgi:tyrosyl-tRNA synthetase
MNTNFIEELRWRGMLHDVTPGAEELLTKQMVKGYIGFDPTADSLGVGNLVQIMTLLHFQQAGHKPIALVGGATGMVGDPSGKSQERNLLDENTLQHNLSSQRKQLEKFLDFNCGDNSAEIVNNYDWFKNIPFLEFIRDTGKYITVNYMLSKDSVKRRIDGTDGAEGMSFTEFTYQLIQGYDYYYLWKNHGIQLQMGGSDQWGNITTGTELIRKKDGGEDAFALTTPLIRKADGSKFGKTEKGNLWLDPKRTSPYTFYQFWINAGDDDVKNYIRIFTLKTREEIEALEAEHAQDPGRRVLQKALAEDITRRVHSEEALQMAIDASGILFGKGTIDTLRKLNDDDFAGVFADVPQKEMEAAAIENGINIIDLIAAQTGYFASNGEARRAMQGNGFSLNKEKISDPARTVTKDDLLNNRYLLLSKSKKDYLLVRVV